jgi:hypothetical protein
MKIIFLFCALSGAFAFAQSPASKWHHAIGLSANRAFVEELDIQDYSGFTNRTRRLPGLGIRYSVLYDVTPKFSLGAGIDYSSINYTFFYHGVSSKNATGIPKLFVDTKFKIKSFFVQPEIAISYSYYYLFATTFGSDGVLSPTKVVLQSTSTNKVFPLYALRAGKTWHKQGLPRHEVAFAFQKGFSAITTEVLERYDPYRRSTFAFKGTTASVSYLFYLHNLRKRK